MSRCRSCGAAITWATTDAGKSMPIEQGPGALAYDPATGQVHHDPAGVWISHFATCGQADEWRR